MNFGLAWNKLDEAQKAQAEDYTRRHKQYQLGHVEPLNRDLKRFCIINDRTPYRHDPEDFARVLSDCIALRNASLVARGQCTRP